MAQALNVGRRASFWNFARADYQAAYINHQPTFLSTENLSIWHKSGLQLQSDGGLYNDPLVVKNDSSHCRDIAEVVSHTLLYLLLRVMNFLACDTASTNSTQWLHLLRQLDEWYLYPCSTSTARRHADHFITTGTPTSPKSSSPAPKSATP